MASLSLSWAVAVPDASATSTAASIARGAIGDRRITRSPLVFPTLAILVPAPRRLPSPLRGGVGGGGDKAATAPAFHPTPNPSPSRGGGSVEQASRLALYFHPSAQRAGCRGRTAASGKLAQGGVQRNGQSEDDDDQGVHGRH